MALHRFVSPSPLFFPYFFWLNVDIHGQLTMHQSRQGENRVNQVMVETRAMCPASNIKDFIICGIFRPHRLVYIAVLGLHYVQQGRLISRGWVVYILVGGFKGWMGFHCCRMWSAWGVTVPTEYTEERRHSVDSPIHQGSTRVANRDVRCAQRCNSKQTIQTQPKLWIRSWYS